MARYGAGVASLALIPPSGRKRAPSRAIRSRSASRGFVAEYRAIAPLASRRVCREPAARRRPALALRPRLTTPTREEVAFACSQPLRAPALRRKRLVRLPAAEGGGWRTRGRSGSSAASVVPLAETLSEEGSGSSRPIHLRVAAATTPRRTVRASTPPPDAENTTPCQSASGGIAISA